MSEMTEFYLSVAVVICVAFTVGIFMRKTPARLFYIIIVSNIFLAAEVAYFISWLAMAPCIFIIVFMSVLVSSPQLRHNPPSDE